MSNYSNENIAVFGHRGSGKSTWLFANMDSFSPFVLVDPVYDPKYKLLQLYTISTLEEALQLFKSANPKRIYISPNLQTFDFFCGLILAKGNITLIVDEVDNYATSYYVSPYFKKLIKIGRHRNINLVAVCRRPKEMNTLIRTQASRFIIFPLGGEDAKDLQSYIPKEVLISVLHLKCDNMGSEYIDYNFKTKNVIKCGIQYPKYSLDSQ